MALKIIIFVLFTIPLLMQSKADNNTETNENNSLSISEDYAALRNDAQWFFQHLEIFADAFAHLLPTLSVEEENAYRALANEKNSTFIENTRLYLLLGLRHLFIGVKEISIALQQKFNTDHVQQLQQLKLVISFIRDLIRIAKDWFAMLRVSLAQIFRLYNHYIPEVLLGKCLGRYIVATYPNRAFYEYPFLLLAEMFEYFVNYLNATPIQHALIESKPTEVGEDISVEQNEIWPHGQHEKTKVSSARSMVQQNIIADSLLNEKQLNSAANGSWQKCLKMYMADTISRQLKSYFLEN